MNRPRTPFALGLVFSTAIVSAFGVASCSANEPLDSALVDAEGSDGDVDPTFGAPNDDPEADDLAGLESPEEAVVDDDGAASIAGAIDEGVSVDEADDGAEADGADVEDLMMPLAARRVASPVPGHGVTYAYGVRNARYAAGFHTGQDHAAPRGRAVVAVRSGRIRWSNDRGGAYGRWIGLDANNGRTYVYCHLSKRRFKAGTRVKAGQRIGRVGDTGNAFGYHLHFEDHPKGPFRYAQVRKPRW